MIHISELSWTHIKHPSEVVNVGDTVDVYIKDINEEQRRFLLASRMLKTIRGKSSRKLSRGNSC